MSKVTETAQSYWDARSELFSNYYKQPSLFDQVFRKGIYERVAVAVKTCKELDEPTVLDIGSGPGINSETILRNTTAKSLFGIDFSQHMIDHAKATAAAAGISDKCEFVLGDVLTYDFGAGKKFDFSMALGVLDYVGESAALVKKMAQLTSGAFVISWPEDGLRMWLRRQRYTCPVYDYSVADIQTLHRNAGVTKLETIRIGGGWASIARM